MSRKRTAGAVVTFAVLYIALSEGWSQFNEVLWSSQDMAANGFWLISAFVGAVIARSKFLLPAVATWTVLWALSILLLYQIAAGFGQGSVLGILQHNALGMVLSFAAVLLGVLSGQYVSARVRRHQSAAV